jgi:DNA-directed RNA polymerase subunit RPC12/RpoP
MTQKGKHTWDLYTRYYRCPKCGWIIEDRQDKSEKEITCSRCNHLFFVKKTSKKSWIPIFTDPQPLEWDW